MKTDRLAMLEPIHFPSRTLHVMLRAIALVSLLCVAAGAQTYTWTNWSSTSQGAIVNNCGIYDVKFAGNAFGALNSYVSFLPASTFGGLDAPTQESGVLQLTGGNTNLQTVTFSPPVLNPRMAIWSLGTPSVPASFVFVGSTPTTVSGGPSDENTGSAITVLGSTVSGTEGNGTIEFAGMIASISWTNPLHENWYGFNVGVPCPWKDVGPPLGGTSGTPKLTGKGTLLAGAPGTLDLSNARPTAPAVLFVSPVNFPTPFKGGTLVPVPSLLTVSLLTNGSGAIVLPFVWPSGVPGGTSLYFQYAIQDAGAVKGVALSNALLGVCP